MTETILAQVLNKRGLNKEQIKNKRLKVLNFPELDKAYNDVMMELFINCKDEVRIGVLYDVDVDGIMSGYILTDFFKRAGKNKVFSFINPEKQHGLVKESMEWVEEVGLDWLFIVDAGSGNAEEINQLVNKGVKVVVLDHHEYEKKPLNKGAWLVNISDHEELPKLSGCGVTYRFIEKFAHALQMDVRDYEIFVGITVLSDMCDMLDNENRFYVKRAYDNYHYNPLLKQFAFYGSKKNFFSFSFIPYINALIRIGEEKRAIVIMNNSNSVARNKGILADSIQVKEKQKEKIERLKKLSKVIVKEGFTLCLRTEAQEINEFGEKEEFGTINGLLANQLLQEYGQPALVVKNFKTDAEDYWRGSFRGNYYGKTLLTEWNFLAQGHEHACGLKINSEHFKKFSKEFKLDDSLKDSVQKDSDILKPLAKLTDSEMLQIAQFNEYTGTGLPPIVVEFTNNFFNIIEHSEQTEKSIKSVLTNGWQVLDFKMREEDETLKVIPTLSMDKKGFTLIRE